MSEASQEVDEASDNGMLRTIQVPKDATVVVFEAKAEGTVTKAADIAAANEAAAAQAAQEPKE